VNGAIAVLHSGASSIRFSLFEEGAARARARGHIEAIHTAPRFVAKDRAGNVIAEKTWVSGSPLGHDGALDHLVGYMQGVLGAMPIEAIGHRIAHGGIDFDQPVRVDRRVLARLEGFMRLAPLHQPHNLAPVRRLLEGAPRMPQVACFDTAFHRTQPEVAQRFGLPRIYHDEGVRRFGFHGLSFESIAAQLHALDAAAARGRIVVLHLGNGANLCALHEGRSVAATMGFTTLDGLLMGTRCGSVDPGVILYLMQMHRMDAKGIERLLYQQSGMLGVSGVSSDVRALLASEDPGARLAIDLYVYRIRREIGSLAAALGGLDALVFTGGVGENSAIIRARVCRDAEWLGVQLDEDANLAGVRVMSAPSSRVKVWRLESDEESVIARHTRRLARSDAWETAHA